MLRARIAAAVLKAAIGLVPVSRRGGWFPLVLESRPGAWQMNIEWTVDSVLAYPAVFACVTRISNDIGKLRSRLMERDADGIWKETSSAAFSPVLRKPNRYQNAIQFRQWWIMSKLTRGNAYALKQRDERGVVVAQYLLDPDRCKPLVADDGSVYYQLNTDTINGIPDALVVPASEIIHDRMNCLFHPLVGVSPLFAAGVSATLGLQMEADAVNFFQNGAAPGGVLEAPGAIGDQTLKELKDTWQTNFTGANRGKVAILGDGLKFNPVKMTAVDAQQVERSKRLDEHICSAFQVPPYIVNLGTLPAGMKPGDLKQIYYDNCLQTLIEEFEACQDEGLNVPPHYGVELDTDALLRMDPASQIETLAAAVGGTVMAPNEARRRINLPPLPGGDTVYLQQQNFSLAALDERDRNDPFKKTPAPAAATALPSPDEEDEPDETERALELLRTKDLVTA